MEEIKREGAEIVKEDSGNSSKVLQNGGYPMHTFEDVKEIYYAYIHDENDRKERMIKRGDKKEDVIKRLNNDRMIFNDSIKTDFVIINKNSTLEELSEKINQLYKEKLSLIK